MNLNMENSGSSANISYSKLIIGKIHNWKEQNIVHDISAEPWDMDDMKSNVVRLISFHKRSF